MPDKLDRDRAIVLIKALLEDVIAARERLDAADTQSARRDVVRASLAMMEGETWLLREHVRESLNNLDELAPLADLALREQTYTVAENGRLVVQPRSAPLPTSIRLVTAQAKLICPDMSVNFTVSGWSHLRQAITIRNRITHPRPDNDLDISDQDLTIVASGLSWLVATTEYVMASTNLALIRARTIIDKLLAGDPDALAEYQGALESAE